MRIVLVGGGTGGHFYPLMAIAEAIRSQDSQLNTESELYYMGPEPYSQESLTQHGVTYVYCPAGKRRRYFSLLNFVDAFKILGGFLVSLWKLYKLYPDAVMSKGGYTSVPVVLAAWWYRIPIVIHESDAKPGAANTLAGKLARYVGITHTSTAQYFDSTKVAHTGMPIRESFITPTKNPHNVLNIPADRPVIFVTGGSLGAERINNLVLDSLDELLPKYTIVHQAGKGKFDKVRDSAARLITDPEQQAHYFIYDHMSGEEIAAALDASSVVVARAGAGTIAEIALKEKPSILIPIPEEISHDQRTNAYSYADKGAAVVIEEKNISDGLLTAELNSILEDENTYQKMKAATKNFTQPGAAFKLADILRSIAAEHS